MLKIIYDWINPSTRVGVCNLISKLFKFDLKDYNQDVMKMTDDFKATYNLILEREDETVKPEAPFFDALLTSVNEYFNTAIKAELTKWESGVNFFDNIKADAIVKYKNILEIPNPLLHRLQKEMILTKQRLLLLPVNLSKLSSCFSMYMPLLKSPKLELLKRLSPPLPKAVVANQTSNPGG